MKVLRINASDTYEIRNQMLRPGLPIESCHFDGDDDEQTFHLGAFVENKLVSVASFFFEKNPTFEDPYQYRLRGMATLPDYQKQGLSRELLKMAFPIVKQNMCSLLWCNAREVATGFYQTVGFEKIDNQFEIEGIGPHFLMYKRV
ncbi:GNAT family N-acetyltransferase [Bacteriovoracaceae bacterium]|nr:GNAT family N-acetyltransferase [Bacteriovoracaceae bacterium]